MAAHAADLSYAEVGEHELATGWLGDGITVAIGSGDPEGIVGQLSDVRRRSLDAIGREHDELEQRATAFPQRRRDRRRRAR